MATYCIYHLIHVTTPYRYIPKLVITDVPESEAPTRDLIERAGYCFGEFGMPWANHGIEKVDPRESPADLVCRIRQGDGERITYAELTKRANAPVA